MKFRPHQLKPARRHAFRCGLQVAALHNGGRGEDAEKVLTAFTNFLDQFAEDRIIRDWLVNEFITGKRGDLPLSGFVSNHDGTITKTYLTAA